MPDTITIRYDEYKRLQRDSQLLAALEAAGVDNWEGYDVAKEAINA